MELGIGQSVLQRASQELAVLKILGGGGGGVGSAAVLDKYRFCLMVLLHSNISYAGQGGLDHLLAS